MSFFFALEAIPPKEEVLRMNRERRKKEKMDRRQPSLFIQTLEQHKIMEDLEKELPPEKTDLPF